MRCETGVGTRCLVDLHFDGFGPSLLGLRNTHVQHAFLELGLDVLSGGVFGEGEGRDPNASMRP